MKAALITLFFMSFFSRLFGAPEPAPKKPAPQPPAEAASQEALDRMIRFTAFLKAQGVPTLESLPCIEDSATSKIRSPRIIAERLVGCIIAAVGGETGDKALVAQATKDFDADKLFTPKEREFLTSQLEVQQQRVQFSWQYERAWVLLWALGYIERLDFPPSISDVPKLVGYVRGKSVDDLVKNAKPRSQKELLDEADLIYRLHWAVVEERVNKTIKVPVQVEKGVVQERHHALNWLIGYLDQDWDDVTTDT
jgi:hypothetical protein